MKKALLFVFVVLFIVLTPSFSPLQAQQQTPLVAANSDEFKSMIMARYDGKTVAPAIDGLSAGEFKKAAFGIGAGSAGLLWYHYHESVPIPDRQRSSPLKLRGKKTGDMQSVDERTFADLQSGLNISDLTRGESLRVSKMYVLHNRVDLELVVTNLGHMRDMDINKANTQTRRSGNNTRITVGNFGLKFSFFFDQDKVMKANDYQTVIAEINKYILPEGEVKQLLEAESNIQIDMGMSEDAVIQKLGKPMKTLTVGNQKSMAYKDMTIVLKNGEVADVKLQ